MNSKLLSNIIRFVFLVLLQVLVLNHVNFLGYINPYLYVMFVVLLPFDLARWKVMIYSFLIGLAIDVFQDSGGAHAASCLVAAFFRPLILRFSYGLSFDYMTVKFYKTPWVKRLTYVAILVFIHQTTLFVLTFFNFSHLFLIVKNTVFSGLFTILLIMLVTALFKKVER